MNELAELQLQLLGPEYESDDESLEEAAQAAPSAEHPPATPSAEHPPAHVLGCRDALFLPLTAKYPGTPPPPVSLVSNVNDVSMLIPRPPPGPPPAHMLRPSVTSVPSVRPKQQPAEPPRAHLLPSVTSVPSPSMSHTTKVLKAWSKVGVRGSKPKFKAAWAESQLA